MQTNRYAIRTMTRQELDIAVEWAAQEGWNPGNHDADCYFSADPNGFLMGFLGDEPIASISVVKYGNTFGFLGFYIVKPDYRGQGYGIRIWNAGMAYLAGLNVGLDGVVAQQDNYKKSGFKLAYRNIRYEGVGGGTSAQPPHIVPLSSLPFERVDAYDRPFFPASRSAFTRAWISQPDSHALGLVENGQLRGVGVMRPCRTGYKIGPLFADDLASAETLFTSLKSRATPADPIFLDVSERNQAAVAMCQRHAMTVSFETARMYTDDLPDLPLDRLFGIASFEIG